MNIILEIKEDKINYVKGEYGKCGLIISEKNSIPCDTENNMYINIENLMEKIVTGKEKIICLIEDKFINYRFSEIKPKLFRDNYSIIVNEFSDLNLDLHETIFDYKKINDYKSQTKQKTLLCACEKNQIEKIKQRFELSGMRLSKINTKLNAFYKLNNHFDMINKDSSLVIYIYEKFIYVYGYKNKETIYINRFLIEEENINSEIESIEQLFESIYIIDLEDIDLKINSEKNIITSESLFEKYGYLDKEYLVCMAELV